MEMVLYKCLKYGKGGDLRSILNSTQSSRKENFSGEDLTVLCANSIRKQKGPLS